ncbi:hypothetical protein VDGD_08962 [Verticillium dahliae]|nr:hypothetical protein VDGD_08962 [Verticillium dahliae]
MDLVAGLVATPFREIVAKAATAVQNAGDDKDMLTEGQRLGRGADRILKAIEPLCDRMLADHGAAFIDALKDNNDIAGYRSRLDLLLWDFDDVITAADYDRSKFIELQALCKEAGLAIREILMRMRLEPAAKDPLELVSPASTHTAQMPGRQPSLPTPAAVEEPEPILAPVPAPVPDELVLPAPTTHEPKIEEPSVPPPPPPAANPWELRMPPPIATGAAEEFSPVVVVERRRPVSAIDSPVEHMSPVASPAVVDNDCDRRPYFHTPRRLDIGVDHMMQESTDRRHLTVSPDLVAAPTAEQSTCATERSSFSGRARSFTGTIPEETAVEDAEAPPFVSATILPSHVYHRYSHTSNHSSDHSHPSRQRSQESLHSSVLEGRRDGTTSPAMMDHRASITSIQAPEENLARAPTIPANFPPGIHDGIEAVPTNQSDYSELIPVDAATTEVGVVSSPPPREQDCSIGLSSSFYLYKGFCEGAKDVMRGGIGIKKTKKPVRMSLKTESHEADHYRASLGCTLLRGAPIAFTRRTFSTSSRTSKTRTRQTTTRRGSAIAFGSCKRATLPRSAPTRRSMGASSVSRPRPRRNRATRRSSSRNEPCSNISRAMRDRCLTSRASRSSTAGRFRLP